MDTTTAGVVRKVVRAKRDTSSRYGTVSPPSSLTLLVLPLQSTTLSHLPLIIT